MTMLYLTDEKFGPAWMRLLETLRQNGMDVGPRGQATKEITNVVFQVRDSRNNILYHPQRKLNYRFMVAEWLWITFGFNDVCSIAQYNSAMLKFSDDGKILKGAYGPWVDYQWSYVVETLQRDQDSRQAVINIFPPYPSPSKDIPCTLSLQFLIRDNQLDLIVTMRSSDVWLGLPYDMFTFTRLQALMLLDLTNHPNDPLWPGSITFHLGSSHLYHRDIPRAQNVLDDDVASTIRSPWLSTGPPNWIKTTFVEKKLPEEIITTVARSNEWVQYGEALVAPTSAAALERLKQCTSI